MIYVLNPELFCFLFSHKQTHLLMQETDSDDLLYIFYAEFYLLLILIYDEILKKCL